MHHRSTRLGAPSSPSRPAAMAAGNESSDEVIRKDGHHDEIPDPAQLARSRRTSSRSPSSFLIQILFSSAITSSPSAINEHQTPKIRQLHARIQPTLARANARSSVTGVISCPRSHALVETHLVPSASTEPITMVVLLRPNQQHHDHAPCANNSSTRTIQPDLHHITTSACISPFCSCVRPSVSLQPPDASFIHRPLAPAHAPSRPNHSKDRRLTWQQQLR
ncbi:hypothetical protein ACLOJK_005980 [Asimina triloba]